MSDTELKPIEPSVPRCQAIDSNGSRCKHRAAWSGMYTSDKYSKGVKNVKVKLCEKHAKMAGWPVGTSMADDEE